jgi:protocatechuate 3,4-dioxygenase beta subunit
MLAWACPSYASVIVQLKVLEGEGSTYRTGARATRGLTVLVTDEAGQPVANAAVSFQLPANGATGVFSSGLRTEVITTGEDGRATVWGMQWGRTPGTVEIRVTAVKDQARAGLISTQYLSDTVSQKEGGESAFSEPHKGRVKWILIAAAVGGATAAGVLLGMSHGSAAASSSASTSGTTIGNPSIIVGHP